MLVGFSRALRKLVGYNRHHDYMLQHIRTNLHNDHIQVVAILGKTEQNVGRYITKSVLMTRPREEWKGDVITRYKALEQFSKEDARLQFLRILRSLPYGNSIFFPVKRIEDPIGLLPAKLILGINKRGVHFFRPVPKEYLHSAELRDIMQFGSSSQACLSPCKLFVAPPVMRSCSPVI